MHFFDETTIFFPNYPTSNFLTTTTLLHNPHYPICVKLHIDTEQGIRFKGAYSEIFGKLIVVKLADMVTFLIQDEKIDHFYLVCKQLQKTIL